MTFDAYAALVVFAGLLVWRWTRAAPPPLPAAIASAVAARNVSDEVPTIKAEEYAERAAVAYYKRHGVGAPRVDLKRTKITRTSVTLKTITGARILYMIGSDGVLKYIGPID